MSGGEATWGATAWGGSYTPAGENKKVSISGAVSVHKITSDDIEGRVRVAKVSSGSISGRVKVEIPVFKSISGRVRVRVATPEKLPTDWAGEDKAPEEWDEAPELEPDEWEDADDKTPAVWEYPLEDSN